MYHRPAQGGRGSGGRVPGADLQFQVTGRAPLYLMMAHNHLRDSWRYQAIGYSIMIVTALVLFRGFSAVIIVAIAPALGVFWTMGMLHFFGLQDNPFNDIIVPVLISLVGLTDAVHLMVEIRKQRATGLETRQAAAGVARVGLACALTSLTTAIGFASLAWAHHEIVREFGWCCVLGVGLTFVSVLTVVPLGCRSPLGGVCMWDWARVWWTDNCDASVRSSPGSCGTIARSPGWRSPRPFCLPSCLQLKPDERRYSGLSESGEAAKALRHLDRSLGGLEFGVCASPGASSRGRRTAGSAARSRSRLDRRAADRASARLAPVARRLAGRRAGEERMTLLELLPPSLKRAFYVPEDRTASVQFRVQDIGIAKYGPVFARIETSLEQISQRHPLFQADLDGDAVWRWRNVYQIVTDLATSLGTASLVIWLILTMVYRSIRIGLISIVPNLFPLVATGAMLPITGQYLELVTVCVFTICIGIAVDDTIHFLTRYTEEIAVVDNHRDGFSGRLPASAAALLMTTIVLVTGMMTAVFGDARDARLFGIMGAITLTAALFADIIFLPALLLRFNRPSSRIR